RVPFERVPSSGAVYPLTSRFPAVSRTKIAYRGGFAQGAGQELSTTARAGLASRTAPAMTVPREYRRYDDMADSFLHAIGHMPDRWCGVQPGGVQGRRTLFDDRRLTVSRRSGPSGR